MAKIDCGSFIDEYSPLLRATIAVSEHISMEKPLYLRQDCEDIIKVSKSLKQEHPEMVSTEVLDMVSSSADDILGMMDLARKQGKPIPYETLSKEGTHLEMLTLEAMILDTCRCVVKEERSDKR